MSKLLTNVKVWIVIVIAVLAIVLKVRGDTIRKLALKLNLKDTELKDSKILEQLGVVRTEKQILEKELSKAKPDNKTPEEIEEFWKNQ